MKNISKNINLVGKAVYWLLFAALIFIAGLVAVSSTSFFGSQKLLVVQSGSMEPSIPMGAMVLTKRSNEYNPGDVITFQNTGDTKYLITHRLTDVAELDNGKMFITKGDANEDADSEQVDPSAVVGKVVWALPLIGYIVSFARTQVGLIALVVIPATIIIYSEILAIKKELDRLKSNLKKKPKASRFFLPKLLLLLLLSGLTVVGQSKSAFTDSEMVTSNLAAADCFDDCEEQVQQEQGPEILFYFRDDKNAVGFVVNGVSAYDSIEYIVDYEHDGGIVEHIIGVIDNSVHTDSILEQWILLGSCSGIEGLVCTYFEDVGEINLTVDLFQVAVVADTLTDSLTPSP